MKTSLAMAYSLLIAFLLIGTGAIHAQKEGIEIGDKAPNIKMKDPIGNTLALEDLKGQMVLIDFWASWCGPCRHENPVVVNAYKQYKDRDFKQGKHFTVFSVSLDKQQKAWTDAIAADKLEWPYHVCDFAGWRTRPAVIYNVRGIPSNFLINGEGIIVAKNLRGIALEQKLKELAK